MVNTVVDLILADKDGTDPTVRDGTDLIEQVDDTESVGTSDIKEEPVDSEDDVIADVDHTLRYNSIMCITYIILNLLSAGQRGPSWASLKQKSFPTRSWRARLYVWNAKWRNCWMKWKTNARPTKGNLQKRTKLSRTTLQLPIRLR